MKTRVLTLLITCLFALPAFGAFDYTVVEISKAADFKSGKLGVQISNITPGGSLSTNNVSAAITFENFVGAFTTVETSNLQFLTGFTFPLSDPGAASNSFTSGSNYGFNSTAFGPPVTVNDNDIIASFDWSVSGPVVKGDSFDVRIIDEHGVGFPSSINGMAPNSFATTTVSVPEPSSIIFFGIVTGLVAFKRFWKKRS